MSFFVDTLAWISTVAALLISGHSIVMHLKHYHNPSQQLLVLRILMMIPVYAVATYLALKQPQHYLMYHAIRDW